MSNRVINLETWRRKNKFDFFVKMANPIVSVTVKVNVDNCYNAAKRDNRSLFILYSWAIIKAVNNVDELRVRAVGQADEIEVIEVVSAIPFMDFTSITTTVSEFGGLNQVPLIAVGAITECNGVKSMPISISFHHGLVDGYHFGQFYKYVQQNLDAF